MFQHFQWQRRIREVEQQIYAHIIRPYGRGPLRPDPAAPLRLMWERSLGEHPQTQIWSPQGDWSDQTAKMICLSLAEILDTVPEVAALYVDTGHNEPHIVVTWHRHTCAPSQNREQSQTSRSAERRHPQLHNNGRPRAGLATLSIEHPIADQSIQHVRWPMTPPLRRVKVTVDQLTEHLSWCPSLQLKSGQFSFDPTASYFVHTPSGTVLFEASHSLLNDRQAPPLSLSRERALRFARWLESAAWSSLEHFKNNRHWDEPTAAFDLPPGCREIAARFVADPLGFDLTEFDFDDALLARGASSGVVPEEGALRRTMFYDSRKRNSRLFLLPALAEDERRARKPGDSGETGL